MLAVNLDQPRAGLECCIGLLSQPEHACKPQETLLRMLQQAINHSVVEIAVRRLMSATSLGCHTSASAASDALEHPAGVHKHQALQGGLGPLPPPLLCVRTTGTGHSLQARAGAPPAQEPSFCRPLHSNVMAAC